MKILTHNRSWCPLGEVDIIPPLGCSYPHKQGVIDSKSTSRLDKIIYQLQWLERHRGSLCFVINWGTAESLLLLQYEKWHLVIHSYVFIYRFIKLWGGNEQLCWLEPSSLNVLHIIAVIYTLGIVNILMRQHCGQTDNHSQWFSVYLNNRFFNLFSWSMDVTCSSLQHCWIGGIQK